MNADYILFTNPTNHVVSLASLGLGTVAPGEDIEIPLPLAAPRVDSGRRGKSILENVAPQLRPKDPAELAAWLAPPAPVIPKSKIVSVAPRPAGEAPGVKALREAREAALAAKAAPAADAVKAPASAKKA